ncbi:MAG TPA: hypothetical protein VHX86_18355 [Tepidisphaeraceae bacterium]|jgi:hypothetical protein|nr:hypothetical protein [Tepidisphaeraceae bacterium]
MDEQGQDNQRTDDWGNATDSDVQRLKNNVGAIRSSRPQELNTTLLNQHDDDRSHLNSLQLQGLNHGIVARRQELENKPHSQEESIDLPDKERVRGFKMIQSQVPANSESDAAHRAKFREGESNGRIPAVQEKEDQFQNAAADEGKFERNAAPQEMPHTLPLTNAQAPSLAAASQLANSDFNAPQGGGDVSILSDMLRKLGDAATKLDKVFSNAKTLVLLKD